MSGETADPRPGNAGQDLAISVPCAAASAVAPMYGTEPEETGDGLD